MSEEEFSADSSKSSSESEDSDSSDSEECASPTPAEETNQLVCFACGKEPKYRCPGCGRRSCSLACVKVHKEKTGCDGKRDKTAFVSVGEFTDSHLLSDYNLLEEIGRCVDSSKRLLIQVGSDSRPPRAKASNLISLARRHGIQFQALPRGMARRAENTSSVNHRLKLITWHVEWHFPNADGVVFNDRVQEDMLLVDALGKYLDPEKGDPAHRCRLRSYCEAGGAATVQLFMHAEKQPANNPGFYLLDGSQSLADNLRGKQVVEFPVISAILPRNEGNYRVVQQETVSTVVNSENKPKELSPLDDLYGMERGNSCPDEDLQQPRKCHRGRFARRGFGRGRHRQSGAAEDQQRGRGRFRGGSRGRGRRFRAGNRPQNGGNFEAHVSQQLRGGNGTSANERSILGPSSTSMANAATLYSNWWSADQMSVGKSQFASKDTPWQWSSQTVATGQSTGTATSPSGAAGQPGHVTGSWQQNAPPANLAWYNFV